MCAKNVKKYTINYYFVHSMFQHKYKIYRLQWIRRYMKYLTLMLNREMSI